HIHFGRTLHVLDIVAALALPRLADLHQKLARLRELQDHVVVEVAGCRLAFGRRSAPSRAPGSTRRTGRGTAVAANPHIAFVIDEDPVIGLRPIVAFAGTTPVADEIARLVELEHRWRRLAAFRFHDTRAPFGTGRICRGVVL